MINAYYRHLTSDIKESRLQAAKAWSTWEMAISRLLINEEMLNRTNNDDWTLGFARLEWLVIPYV